MPDPDTTTTPLLRPELELQLIKPSTPTHCGGSIQPKLELTEDDVVEHYAARLEGCAPLVPQLPTDLLGPAEQHRQGDIVSASAYLKGDDALPDAELSAQLLCGLATLMGRYSLATELAMGLWRDDLDLPRCQPLRVSLLRQPGDTTPELPPGLKEEESSVVAPLSSYASSECLIGRLKNKVAFPPKDGRMLLTEHGVRKLDMRCPNQAQSKGCRSMEVFLVLGAELPASCPQAAVTLRYHRSNLEMRCHRGLFSPDTVSRMLRHLTTVVASCKRLPSVPLCQLPLQLPSSPDETEVSAWADAYSSSCYAPGAKEHFSADRTMTSMIEAAAKSFPRELAILDDASGTTYTYEEVLRMSGSLAFALHEAGVVPDKLVPLMASRGVEMILGLLGILRTGSGYVPLDLHWPDDRLEDVLRQCGSKVLLASSDCHTKLSSIAREVHSVTVMDIKSHLLLGKELPDQGHGTTLAYTFFTSGTTGKPKGVMVENQGLVHRIHWFQQRWPLRPGEGVVSKVAYTFGLSEWEIFWPLVAGATLILAPPGGEKDAEYLLRRACNAFTLPEPQERLIPGKGPNPEYMQYVAAHVFVPSMLQMVFEKYDELEEEDLQRKGHHQTDGAWWHHSKCREVITCAEALNPPLAQKMFSRFRHCTLTNLYGPTEGEMTYWDVPQGRAVLRVSAGAPMEGSKVVLSDLREPKLAASLEPAEIGFGGPFIARGYLGRPDLDAKAFVHDFTSTATSTAKLHCHESGSILTARTLDIIPNNSIEEGIHSHKEHGDRLYLTGDLGRWREGQVDLLGRKDFQVKLRGFRIELGEIEAACRAAGARAAVCILRKSSNGTQGLVAYYEPGDGEVHEAAVRASCQKSLPPYMQPQAIMRLAQLPRNTNGKVDRAKLPEVVTLTIAGPAQSPPETPVQKTAAAVIADVLGLPLGSVNLDSDFQELGGNSLLMGRASTAIKKTFSLTNFKSTAMYQLGTVRRIAAAIEIMLEQKSQEVVDESPLGQSLSMAELPRRSQCSSTSFCSLCMQGIGVFYLSLLAQSQAWSPAWWAAWFIYEYHGTTGLFIYLPFARLLHTVMMFTVVLTLKWLILGRVKPGTLELWSAEYYRWWFVNTLLKHFQEHEMPLIANTSLANFTLRALGAKVGQGAKISDIYLHDPDLLEVGAYATIGERARLATSSVLHGQVHLGTICIGEEAAVGPTAVLSQDTVVAPRKAVVPLSTMPGWHGPVGSVAYQDAQPPRDPDFDARQNLLRVIFGLPAVLIGEAIPYYATYFVLVRTYDALHDKDPARAFTLWTIILPWIFMHPLWIVRTFVIILQKWLLIGDFRKQSDELSHWNEWKHWVHGRTVDSHDFKELCTSFTNTEILSYIYRALGTRIGSRVQIDQLTFTEHDCIQIDDYVVFGSRVMMCTDTQAPWVPTEFRKKMKKKRGPNQRFADIKICTGANVLDHCTLLPGVTVAERAVLGTYTLAPAGSYYPPLAIHSGNQRGRSMHLRDYFASPAMRELEDKTMQDLDDPLTWWRFNLFIVFLVLLAKPIPEAAWVATYFGVTAIWDFEEDGLLIQLIFAPFVYNFIEGVLLLMQIALKWIIIGKFKAGEYKFFGYYHTSWMIMRVCGQGISTLMECLHGTVFQVWVARACGSTIGEDCYLAGIMVEYDLLSVGDHVAIGTGCDTTCHTVENMVIKLAPTRIGDGAALLPGSFIMPGSVMQDEAVLMEHTQVLKGETVPTREVWAGMPASGCAPVSPKAYESHGSLTFS